MNKLNIDELKAQLDRIRKENLYVQGRYDCANNVIPNDSLGEDYLRGYADEFSKEQQLSRGFN